MIRLFSILLVNGWRGLSRKNGLLAALTLLFAGATFLTISGNADATISSQANATTASRHITMATLHDSQNRQIAMVLRHSKDSHSGGDHAGQLMQPQGSDNNQIAVNVGGSNSSGNGEAGQPATGSDTSGSGSADGGSSSPAPTVSASVQTSPVQTVCSQGQTTYQVSSAQVKFQTPPTSDTSLTWYWETRIDSGTAPSQPISSNQQTQSISASTSVVTLTANDPSQPLLSTISATDYAYSFRLHVVGPTNAVSDWVSVSPAASSCAQTFSAQDQSQNSSAASSENN